MPVAQVAAERPDVEVLLGVWAVTGNHELHRRGGHDGALATAGLRVLHDRWVALRPGLALAGVHDLSSRSRDGTGGEASARAVAGAPPGALVLFSHTPWHAERAAAAGVATPTAAMWPFSELVCTVYPLLGGRHEVGGMTVIVCRGTGTWGPRMRLWRPAEVPRVTLRAAPVGAAAPAEATDRPPLA